jgi:sulfite exporter TauE/SafE
MKQTALRYTFSEAILAAIIGSLIYCAVAVLLIHGTREFIERLVHWLKIVLPIAMIGLPLVGVPLARGLKRIRQDGIPQAIVLGAATGALACFVVVSAMSFLVIIAEDNSATLGAVLLHSLKTAPHLYLKYGASGGALAAGLFIAVSQLRAHWKHSSPFLGRGP